MKIYVQIYLIPFIQNCISSFKEDHSPHTIKSQI